LTTIFSHPIIPAYFGPRKEGRDVPSKDVVLTPDGLKKLQEEIDYLSVQKREEVAERIRQAREFGDISENSEYDDAKNEQAMLEHRISVLQEKLRQARVIKITEISADKVSIGSTVTLRDVEDDEEFTYTLVGSAEADPSNHRLSNESPTGQAILGKKVGDMVTVPVPAGALKYEVLKIEVA
jgi:transcription elongation factor GreA